MKVIGLTGGIATGKSTVSETIKQEGVAVVDCDKIAHDVARKGRWGYRRVVQTFGEDVLRSDGELDRPALGSIIFNDPSARKKLNKFVDMPLLFETGSDKWFSKSLLVACKESAQTERLMNRDGCSRAQAEAKIMSQMPLRVKRERSSLVIENDGSREETAAQARKLIRELRNSQTWTSLFVNPIAVAICLAGAILLIPVF